MSHATRPVSFSRGWWSAAVILALGALGAAGAAPAPESKPDLLAWPPVRQETRPWTRWWWLGSAVDEAEVTRSLELFHGAGLGGVEISPIYGAKGAEARSISYLSPRWVGVLGHTSREARRLGMGVDMIEGTGWPFGGPWVDRASVADRLELTAVPLDAEGQPTRRLPSRGTVQALVAHSDAGQRVDLTGKLDAAGKLDWSMPAGKWTLYAAQMRPSGQQVKRAAPGGEGPVLDHFGREAVAKYLQHFETSLATLPRDQRPRCLFNDSFEVYGANWTPNLFAEFQKRRGYDLRQHLPALMGQDAPEQVARVHSDYRETVSDLLLNDFVRQWTESAHRLGARSRNQAHGSPGNLLDLYAAADIPETEMFGPGRREDSAHPASAPAPPARWQDMVVCKMASSAAHVTGKPLCSSESMTWLGEHFRVPLADMKGQADSLFVAGINHLFYHGAPFTPKDAEWPGWLFYAATDVTPHNTWWRDFPALNGYLTRCQSFLQAGKPDNDVLLYFPVYDLWSKERGAKDLLQYATVHNTDDWLEGNLPGFAGAARQLWQRGYGFDMVSDAQLQAVEARDGLLRAPGGNYRTLLVAGCERMPDSTLERLLRVAQDGGTVLVAGELPKDVPGLADLDARRARFKAALATLGAAKSAGDGISEFRVGAGRVLQGADAEALLRHAHVARETATDEGLELTRRAEEGGSIYFLANRSAKRIDGWVPLAAPARGAVLFDPMTGLRGLAAVQSTADGHAQIYLQLDPGETAIVRTRRDAVNGGPEYAYRQAAGAPQELRGEWRVDFVEGGPSLPQPVRVSSLGSWTTYPGETEKLKAFSGTARYRLTFRKPAGAAQAWELDLGDVRHSARVRLNGKELGTLIAPPYRVELSGLQGGDNVLEVEVTNLMANRIADLDRRKVAWQKFYFVNLQYKPFDASGWEPALSGLLGPVRLTPLREIRPR